MSNEFQKDNFKTFEKENDIKVNGKMWEVEKKMQILQADKEEFGRFMKEKTTYLYHRC